ncbi:TPA: type II toxin-antitoxin system mRNA interferase toxin, RelE/StbE family [Candidatus Micrarchaeota archaeon]|nr:type II toxin-antitoxin system mRNA interferase toxin, RelE/StbE family [Candidatus Micrarchaeota archaeon]
MDKIDKLLCKIPRGDRLRLANAISMIVSGEYGGLDRKKLKGYDCIYRACIGRYRIIYYDDGKEIWIKAIKRRDESTYNSF